MEFTKCQRCGRKLTNAKSVAAGYGPSCLARKRQEQAIPAEYKPHQVDSARLLIEDGGIVHLRGQRLFLTVSSDGTRIHRTDARGYCSCPAGLKATRCYHTLAARMLLAA